MSLFDGQPLNQDEIRRRTLINPDGMTVRKISASGKVHTMRHKPWWMAIGKGPDGQTCRNCQHLKTIRHSGTYFKCGQQIMTSGTGTDIRKKDEACRLFQVLS